VAVKPDLPTIESARNFTIAWANVPARGSAASLLDSFRSLFLTVLMLEGGRQNEIIVQEVEYTE
jgi:hypothetical protein